MRSVTALISLGLAIACGAKLDRTTIGETFGVGAAADSEQNASPNPEGSPSPSTAPNGKNSVAGSDKTPYAGDDVFAPEAQAPVAIGGAFLSCSQDAAIVECTTFNKDSQPYAYPLSKAYIVTADTSEWQEVNTIGINYGKWQLERPEAIDGSFAITFTSNSEGWLADWIVDSEAPPKNLVRDGSFENFLLEGDSDLFSAFPGDSPDWTGRLPSDPLCPKAVIEIKSSTSVSSALDGDQFAELNSLCSEGGGYGPNNTILGQSLNLVPGRLYQIVFALALSQERIFQLSRVSVMFGSEELLQSDVSKTGWTQFTFVREAKAASVNLSFKDLRNDVLVAGTLLDDVQVYDLGASPSPVVVPPSPTPDQDEDRDRGRESDGRRGR